MGKDSLQYVWASLFCIIADTTAGLIEAECNYYNPAALEGYNTKSKATED